MSNGWLTGGGFQFEPQANLAVQFYNALASQLDASDPRTANITTTGHSLGGGLGGLVSMLYGRPGVEFDNMPFEGAAQST